MTEYANERCSDTLTSRITPRMREALEAAAYRQRLSIGSVVRNAIEIYLADDLKKVSS